MIQDPNQDPGPGQKYFGTLNVGSTFFAVDGGRLFFRDVLSPGGIQIYLGTCIVGLTFEPSS